MNCDELCFTPATELSRLIRDGQLGAREVTEAVLERIEAVEPKINSYITVCADVALAEADAADAAQARGYELGPLHGLPLGIKDLLNTKGIKTTFASYAFADNVPDADCVSMGRLRDAGAILIGKTTTPEFGHKPMTEAPLFGKTRNPWKLSRTAGGSSGETGEAWAPGFLRMGLSFFVAFAIGAVFRMFFRLAIMFVGVLALTIIGLSQVDLVTVHWGNIEQLWGGFVDRIGEDFGQLRTTLTGSLPQAGLGTLGLVAGFKKG